jgi:hypothetical protein
MAALRNLDSEARIASFATGSPVRRRLSGEQRVEEGE